MEDLLLLRCPHPLAEQHLLQVVKTRWLDLIVNPNHSYLLHVALCLGLPANASRSSKGVFCPFLSQSIPHEVWYTFHWCRCFRLSPILSQTFTHFQLCHDVSVVHLPKHSVLVSQVSAKQVFPINAHFRTFTFSTMQIRTLWNCFLQISSQLIFVHF